MCSFHRGFSLNRGFTVFDTWNVFSQFSYNLLIAYRFVSASSLEVKNTCQNYQIFKEAFLYFKSTWSNWKDTFKPSLGPSNCVWSNCSCTKTCADLAEPEIESCTEETCKPGWVCPPGLVVHNNRAISPVLVCPCYHNETFYKVRLVEQCPKWFIIKL